MLHICRTCLHVDAAARKDGSMTPGSSPADCVTHYRSSQSVILSRANKTHQTKSNLLFLVNQCSFEIKSETVKVWESGNFEEFKHADDSEVATSSTWALLFSSPAVQEFHSVCLCSITHENSEFFCKTRMIHILCSCMQMCFTFCAIWAKYKKNKTKMVNMTSIKPDKHELFVSACSL